MADVKMVVCLNRERNVDPLNDSSKPNFGLSNGEYDGLLSSVTHPIHNARPMSAKRALPGFESQFQVMRNLVDFACQNVSRRPESSKFSFQMVSSVGVFGHYGLGNGEKKTMVPEARVGIDSVLPGTAT
ncbi:MAG: hypothetical protein Q9196_005983 [Gyalolechia fulgens]